MSDKTSVAKTEDLFNDSDIELAPTACYSASYPCAGHSKLLGGFLTNASTLGAASGVRVYQSFDGGANWDIVSSSAQAAADAASPFDIDIVGDFVRFVWTNGADAASGRGHLYLRP